MNKNIFRWCLNFSFVIWTEFATEKRCILYRICIICAFDKLGVIQCTCIYAYNFRSKYCNIIQRELHKQQHYHGFDGLCAYNSSGAEFGIHDDVIKWKHFPRNWPFVREIHRSPVNFPHKGQWRGALMFSLIYAWINDWVNNREAGDLRRQHGHYDVIVMLQEN